jgi:hypothetical protein
MIIEWTTGVTAQRKRYYGNYSCTVMLCVGVYSESALSEIPLSEVLETIEDDKFVIDGTAYMWWHNCLKEVSTGIIKYQLDDNVFKLIS